MKKLKTFAEIGVFVATLPLLVFTKINHPAIDSRQSENVPEVKKSIKKESTGNNTDAGLPTLLNTKFIVINY